MTPSANVLKHFNVIDQITCIWKAEGYHFRISRTEYKNKIISLELVAPKNEAIKFQLSLNWDEYKTPPVQCPGHPDLWQVATLSMAMRCHEQAVQKLAIFYRFALFDSDGQKCEVKEDQIELLNGENEKKHCCAKWDAQFVKSNVRFETKQFRIDCEIFILEAKNVLLKTIE